MPKKKPGTRRANGEGQFELRKADQKVRLVKTIDKVRIVGPFENTRAQAIESWAAKYKRILQRAEEIEQQERAIQIEKENRTVGDHIYYCLFGVYAATKRPNSVGPWAHELAETTYNLYKDAFRSDIKSDPVAQMKVSEVTKTHLEEMRSRMLAKVTTYQRKKNDYRLVDGELRKVSTMETVTRKPRNRRTVARYMQPVFNVLAREGNHCYKDLGKLKLSPPKKSWMRREDRADYLALMPSPEMQIAVRLMLSGLCVGEVSALKKSMVSPEGIIVTEQNSIINGAMKNRPDLKRPRRYRTVPIDKELRRLIMEGPDEIVGIGPDHIRDLVKRATAGTRFAHIRPHDLRRSGAKWMLDAGAKLNDVAAILGNDPKTLLVWYDVADMAGMESALQRIAQ